MSDHTPLTFSLVTNKPTTERKLVSFRKLKYIDIDRLYADVQQSSLVQMWVYDGVDDLVQQHDATLTRILDEHAPLKTQYITDRLNIPWYTEEILDTTWQMHRVEGDNYNFKKS